MATINFATREIRSKIVYFGASGAGCNTNVERLWHLVESRRRSSLHRFGPREHEERSWYFDFVPVRDPPVEGFQLCWQIYSLPGGIEAEAHREEVLDGVDAVVFVADARPDRTQANVDHLLELEAMLTRRGLELSVMTVVLQINHRDANDARPMEALVSDLNPYNFPVVEAVAKEGTGVLETREEVASSVVARVRDTLAGEDTIALTATHAQGESDTDVIRKHVEMIRTRSEAPPEETVDEVEEREEGAQDAVTIEVPFQPREFVGSHPVRVLDATVGTDGVRVRLEMQHMGGGDTRRLEVVLANRPVDSPAIPLTTVTQSVEAPADRVFDYLPDDDVIGDDDEQEDMPGIWYGILGITGGMIIGLLSAYLLGFLV